MSLALARAEFERFLGSNDAEVLSVSGRWGVGKTHAWKGTLKAVRASAPLRRYSYVSAFGLHSLGELKEAIFQSTVSLDGDELEPTVESFREHVSSLLGIRTLGESFFRKTASFLSKVAHSVPYAGKIPDLLMPGAGLLIRKQIVCIDDIERAGQGLSVTDILGFVSFLREQRRCKVVLLLNKEGLGDAAKTFDTYLEKVVDHAVTFEPTARESADIALQEFPDIADLVECVTKLGITNIRVIRRIKSNFDRIQPELRDLHKGVRERVVRSIALLGWCVFEPKLGPDLKLIGSYNEYSDILQKEPDTEGESRTRGLLQALGFSRFEEIEKIILEGLQCGTFNMALLKGTLKDLDRYLSDEAAVSAIRKPWRILQDSFDENTQEMIVSLIESIEKHADKMAPADASDVLAYLRELGREDDADRLLSVYVKAQDSKPREFFAQHHGAGQYPLDPLIVEAFQKKVETMPSAVNVEDILLKIATNNSWSPSDTAYLAMAGTAEYVGMIKRLKGMDLRVAIRTALSFPAESHDFPNEGEVKRQVVEALRQVAQESHLNRLRMLNFLGK